MKPFLYNIFPLFTSLNYNYMVVLVYNIYCFIVILLATFTAKIQNSICQLYLLISKIECGRGRSRKLDLKVLKVKTFIILTHFHGNLDVPSSPKYCFTTRNLRRPRRITRSFGLIFILPGKYRRTITSETDCTHL